MAQKKKKRTALDDFREELNLGSNEEYRKENLKQTFINAQNNKKAQNRSWFNSGAFSDGYDFGDITKTILGTASDVQGDLLTGAGRILEGTVDTGAWIFGKGAEILGKDELAEKTKKFIARDILGETGFNERASNTGTIGLLNSVVNKDDNMFTAPTQFVKNVSNGDGIVKALGESGTSSNYEKSSVLSDKSDSLVESGGQLIGQLGLQTVGVPWWVTSGVSSFGGEAQNAFNNGASYNQAGFSGLVSTGSEILSEKIFGGISFGGKTLDEGIKRKISNAISNKVLNKFVNLGFDAFGEGTEEVLSDIGSRLGRKLSYESDKTWKEMFLSEEAMDSYLDNFIGGSVLGGISSVSTMYRNNKISQFQEQQLQELEQRGQKLETDYQNGLITEEQYQEEASRISEEAKIFKQEQDNNEVNPIIEIEADKSILDEKLNRGLITEQEYDKQVAELDNKLKEIVGKDKSDTKHSLEAVKELQTKTFEQNKNKKEVQFMPIEELLTYKKRGGYRTEEQIEKLTENIKENGITTPIDLVENSDGSIEIYNGNHRLEIAQKLGLKEIPVKYINNSYIDNSKTANYNNNKEKYVEESYGETNRVIQRTNPNDETTRDKQRNSDVSSTSSRDGRRSGAHVKLLSEMARYNNRSSTDSTSMENDKLARQVIKQNRNNIIYDIDEGIKKQRVKGQWVSSPNSNNSFSNTNIPQNNKNIKFDISNNSNMQENTKNSQTPQNGKKYSQQEVSDFMNGVREKMKTQKVMNPNEISKLTKEQANTTPKLPNKKISTGKGKSKFADNIMNKTDMLEDTSKEKILAQDEVKYYEEVTNKESLDKAFDRLENGGSNETMSWFNRFKRDEHGKMKQQPTSIDVAEGWILMKQYQDVKDYDSMVQVAKTMRDIGTEAGQTVQAFNIMERMTPEGMVKYAQSELSEAYDKMVKNKTREWIESNRDKFDLTPSEVEFIMNNMKEISTMEDGYDKKVKLAEIQKLMTDKLPPERGAGIKAWMRISMLFNPKTQVRNVLGNAIISPVNAVGDTFAAMVDKAVSKKTGVRTTGTTKLSSYGKGIKKGLFQSYNDFKKGINTRNIEGNRFEIGEGKSFDDSKKIGKTLNRVDNMLSFMLDAGDRMFYEASFTNSINNQLVLNKTDVVTQDMIDIATSEALQRTWQDNNNYTKFVLGIRRGLNNIINVKGYGLGDVLIPFAKTPANLTKALVDYSPAGLINTINSGIKLKRSLTNGQYTAQMQHQFVQNLGKATAGTMLYILGYALAKSGALSGESDDDKDVANFMKNTLGTNSYSIKIGNKSFTYDWAQPVAGSFSIMANLVNSQKNSENKDLLENILSTLDTAGNIIFEQSFMDSINTVLNNKDGVATGIRESIEELPSRAIPTFSKQIADLIDPTQRTSFEKDKPLETSKNKVIAKIPFASKTLAPSVDTLGREIQKYGGKNNIFNVFFNPANVNSENISESAKEIYRLYKSTGDKTIMPRVAPYEVKIGDTSRKLTSTEKSTYQKKAGMIVEDEIKDLLSNNKYQNLNNSEKVVIVSDIINYAYNKIQSDMFGNDIAPKYKNVDKFVDKGGTISEYYCTNNILESYESDYKDKKDALDNSSLYYDREVEKLSSKKRKNIVSTILNTNATDEAKGYLLSKYYGSEEKINAIIKSEINFNEYLKFMSKEYTSDKTKSGKTITNSRKKKVFKAVESLKLSVVDKAMLIRLEYPSFDTYNSQIIQKVNSLSMSKNEKAEILEQLGFKVKGGRVYW